MQDKEQKDGKEQTRHYLNQEHLRGLDEVTEYEGNNMLNFHKMYPSDGSVLLGNMPASNEAYCVGDACPKHKGAKATNQMILDSYMVPGKTSDTGYKTNIESQ